jgi:hypothetical protein
MVGQGMLILALLESECQYDNKFVTSRCGVADHFDR